MAIPLARVAAALSLPILLVPAPVRGQVNTREAFEKSLALFQRSHQPELFRYSGLSMYGESLTKTKPSPEMLQDLKTLFEQAVQSGSLSNPSKTVLALIHELLAWVPEMRESILQRLTEAPCPEESERNGALVVGILASGQTGEATILHFLESKDPKWQAFAQSFLSQEATSPKTARRAHELALNATSPTRKAELLAIVAQVGDPALSPNLMNLAKESPEDEVQAAAIYGVVELQGYSSIPFLAALRTHGPKAEKELKDGLDYLKKETNLNNPFGMEVSADLTFCDRFSDLGTPSMDWLRSHHLLDRKNANNPRRLTATETDQLLTALLDSKGFGLEVAKGYLFRSLESRHIGALLQLREVNWISPNSQSRGRDRTLKVLIRGLRRGLPQLP